MTQNIYSASFLSSIIQGNISQQEKEQENVDHTQEEKKQASSEIHLEMTQMTGLKDKDLKMAMTMLRNSWEMTALMSEQVGTQRIENCRKS